MKLISLNTWGGRIKEPLDAFVREHSKDTDIFCFQEVHADGSLEADLEAGERPDFLAELQGILPDFQSYFTEQVPGTGLAVFIRNTVEVENISTFLLLSAEELSHLKMDDGSQYYPRIVQMLELRNPHLIVCNFHGVHGSHKKETPERTLQTARLLEVLGKHAGPKILVGDFNLNPDTESIARLEAQGRNLVKEGGFTTTRSSYYTKREHIPFADYAFVSPDLQVSRFEVLPDEVSDHLPLLLEFSIPIE